MNYTAIKIYIVSCESTTNKYEKALLCGGFFIYVAWLLAANTMHGALIIEGVFGFTHYNCFRVCFLFYGSFMVYILISQADLIPVFIFAFIWISYGVQTK